MRKITYAAGILLIFFSSLIAHCQMPCGIYHDDMVFDQIDQYVETMVKAIAKLKDNKNANAQERNEFVRWVATKDHQSDDVAQLILTYFLQQKIKPGDADTAKKLERAHRLLFDAVAIKQNVDFKTVSDFAEEWEAFKLMFHVKGYECEMEKKNLKLWDEKRKEYEEKAKAEEKKNAGATENSKAAQGVKENNGSQSKDGKAKA